MDFLKAEWRKLAIANYHVSPQLLAPYLPHGTELDLWDGKCYLSLVGFMFLNTRILGMKIPLHINFEEVNLRFYVRRFENGGWKRGVVFIKEIVPKYALSFVANTIYDENYETMKMNHVWEEGNNERKVEYRRKKRNTDWQFFSINTEKQLSEIKEGSEAEFITEHYWGYAKVGNTKTNEYEVTHPRWNQYIVNQHEIRVDFGKIYGSEFQFLSNADPDSVMLAEGSEISVKAKSSF